ncbi:piggyBac transposable element-derived protein 4-like [Bactrocera dorsalis]|uniref:PiggyBac transposable element-derived protein 4-like n=1 Tax=Bactrocera dorsalis TaxID=27457 RepID=A0ABM3JHF0_BACDO|nr:piggyBac transposable element-derived protein 4-like [Bactrocera dorsalis]
MNYESSEDGFETDDNSVTDPDFDPEGDISSDFELDCKQNDVLLENEREDIDVRLEESAMPTNATQKGSSHRPKPKMNVVWKKKNIELNEHQIRFTGKEELPADILDLETPIQFFLKIFPLELIKDIAQQTNLYIREKDPNNSFHVSEIDVQQFIGITYMMSLVHLPRVTKHWNNEIGTPFIKETLAANKFEKLRQCIHFNDNSKMLSRDHPQADRVFNIRPILAKLDETCKKIPLQSQLCVDEQICSTKVRHNLKRYNPKKPKK